MSLIDTLDIAKYLSLVASLNLDEDILRKKKEKIKMEEEAKKKQYKMIDNWRKAHQRAINLHFNKDTDADVLEKLDSVPSKADYVRRLVREDLKK